MKKVISISAFLLLFAGAAWLNSSCNKENDTTTSAVTPTEEVVTVTGDGAEDRACSSPCSGFRVTTGGGGEATDYTLKIYNRICPNNAWSLVGTWNENTWPLFPMTPQAFSIVHGKTYMIEATNHQASQAYFGGFKIYNTWTNMVVNPFTVNPGQTVQKTFSSIGNCNCGWIYSCPGPDDE